MFIPLDDQNFTAAFFKQTNTFFFLFERLSVSAECLNIHFSLLRSVSTQGDAI